MLTTGIRRAGIARRAALAAVTASLLALAGCSSVIDGHPSLAPRPAVPTPNPSNTSGAPAPTGSAPTTPDFPSGGSSSSAPATALTPAGLHSLLMAAPSGSKGWGDSWGNNTYPSVQQFVTRQYPAASVSTVVAELDSEGVTSITHRTWIAKNGTQADIVLFAFASAAGAADRYQVASSSQAENTGVVTVPFSASHEAAAYRHSAADDDGYITGIVYSFAGPVVAEIFTYTPHKRFDSASTASWAKTQIARI